MVKIKIGMAIRASPIVYNKRLIGNWGFVFHCNQQIQTFFFEVQSIIGKIIPKGIKYCVNALRWVKVAMFFSVVVSIFFDFFLMIETFRIVE
jgi:hypothetical protein